MKNRDKLRLLKVDQDLWSIHPAALNQLSAKLEHASWLDEDAEEEKKKSEPQSILRVEDGVGIIPVTGTLMSESHWLFDWFGETSYEAIQRAAQEAKNRSDIQVVKTWTDSPGGLVSGAHNTSDAIRDLAQAKPVVGYNANQMCSAAYWVNAHATRIVSAPTGFVGSTGVATVHREISGMEKRMGIKSTDIASGDLKRIGSLYEPLTEEARAYLQQQCVDCAAVFVGDVAGARKLTAEQHTDIARAGTYLGAQALSVGLVDSVGLTPHFNTIVNTLRESRRTTVDLGHNITQGGPTMATPEELKAAQATERKRIADIKALAPAGMEAFAESLAFAEEGYTVEQAGLRILAEQKANPPKPREEPKAAATAAAAETATRTALNKFADEAPDPVKVTRTEPVADPKTEEAAYWDKLYAQAAKTHNANNTRGSIASVRE